MFRNAGTHQQPGSTNPSRAATGGGIQHIDVRHHSPNPPIVGGSGNIKAKNAGAIDGTQMSRKP